MMMIFLSPKTLNITFPTTQNTPTYAIHVQWTFGQWVMLFSYMYHMASA